MPVILPVLLPFGRYRRGLEWASEHLQRQGLDESAVQSALQDLSQPLEHPWTESHPELQRCEEPKAGTARREAPAVKNGDPIQDSQTPNSLAGSRGAIPATPAPGLSLAGKASSPLTSLHPSSEYVLVEEAWGDVCEGQEIPGEDVSRRKTEPTSTAASSPSALGLVTIQSMHHPTTQTPQGDPGSISMKSSKPVLILL